MTAPDFLEQARAAELETASRVTRECRRPVPAYDQRDMGPTEAWRLHLALTDPEFDFDESSEAA